MNYSLIKCYWYVKFKFLGDILIFVHQIAICICEIGNTMKLLQSGNMKGDTHRSVSPTQIYCRATFWSVILNRIRILLGMISLEMWRKHSIYRLTGMSSLFWMADIIEQLEEGINTFLYFKFQVILSSLVFIISIWMYSFFYYLTFSIIF